MTPRTATLFPFLASLAFIAPASAAEETAAPAFVRKSDDGRSLQTAVRTYVHPARASVTIVGTVHVATSDYYSEIASKLPSFDSVLVEGVTRRGTVAPRVASYDYAGALRLVQQSQTLDLRRMTNVINADLDGAAFDRARAAKAQATPPGAPASTTELASGLLSLATDRATLLATEEAYAIRARHEVVLQSLRQRLARGDFSIALLYGIAHGSDLHARLLQLGFKEQSTEWLDAFDVD